jgi:isopentenyl phosphate kinase
MIFLKLGGSLITHKDRPLRSRDETIKRLAGEIAQFIQEFPNEQLLLGHGSGSFGHHVAAKHQTHLGASGAEDWRGFAEVWMTARRLNRIVMDALHETGVAAVAFPPSASVLCKNGEIESYAFDPVQAALEAGLVAVVYGDVAFDSGQGACIVSTERVFAALALVLLPDRVLFAGVDEGVYADYPARTKLMEAISEPDLENVELAGAETEDVTGGMADKVLHALALAGLLPGAEVRIFSGEPPGAVLSALRSDSLGTLVRSDVS